MIKENISKLQLLMKEKGIDVYIVPTADFHQSEYVGEYFKSRKFLTGFTGSAGTVIITANEVCLWVDGRYFIQAEKQIAGTGITLMKMGMPGVPTIKEFLADYKDSVLGFDGRTMSSQDILDFGITHIVYEEDLIDSIWDERPIMSKENGFLYDIKYCGEARQDKLTRIREAMQDCDHHIITALDDIAWIFNIRGKDIACNPTLLAYAIINKEDSYLYVQDGTLASQDITTLAKDHIIIKEYHAIYEDVKTLTGKVLLDTSSVNYAIYKSINPACTLVDATNPSQMFKAIKNDVEIKNTIQAHIKDGVAVTKLMYWLKTHDSIDSLDELSISNKLTKLRKEQDDFYDLSFETICGYQENGALMHYKATKENYSVVKPEGLLLIDSGGQYLDGTTDITRTFALGPITKEQSKDFTIVLKALMRLSSATFLHGADGTNLDILARGVVYQYGLDYRCGTGHGVGHFLGVHEGPNGFRPKNRPGMPALSIQEEGMITTNEPGIYKEGEYGIRLENELLCVKDVENEYGQFMKFKTITYCPFDMDAVDWEMLDCKEVQQLYDYHVEVYDKISTYLNEDEKAWLKEFTKIGD